MSKFKHGNLVGLVGIYLLLGVIRKQQTRAAVVDAVTLLVKNFPGYQITTCKTINVIDENKAYNFAYSVGKNSNSINIMFDKLFGKANCWSTLEFNNQTAHFVYNLFLYAAAGSIKNNKLNKEGLIKASNGLRNDLKTLGFDTSKWVQDPEQFIAKIIKELN